jgi:hypothetical protein
VQQVQRERRMLQALDQAEGAHDLDPEVALASEKQEQKSSGKHGLQRRNRTVSEQNVKGRLKGDALKHGNEHWATHFFCLETESEGFSNGKETGLLNKQKIPVFFSRD